MLKAIISYVKYRMFPFKIQLSKYENDNLMAILLSQAKYWQIPMQGTA